MANKKIIDLPDDSSIADTELIFVGNPANGALSKTTKLVFLSAIQTLVDSKAPIASPNFTGTVGGITAAMVGLGSVNNTSDASKPISTATQTALDAKAPSSSPSFTGTVTGVSKTMVGLGNVDNTSDATKNSALVTLTSKTINLANNTLTGTLAEFNAALSGADFVSIAGTETLTNKTLTSPLINTVATINATQPLLKFSQSSTLKSTIGVADSNGAIATGSLTGETVFRNESSKFLFSNNTTNNLKVGWVLPSDTAAPVAQGAVLFQTNIDTTALGHSSEAFIFQNLNGENSARIGWLNEDGELVGFIGPNNQDGNFSILANKPSNFLILGWHPEAGIDAPLIRMLPNGTVTGYFYADGASDYTYPFILDYKNNLHVFGDNIASGTSTLQVHGTGQQSLRSGDPQVRLNNTNVSQPFTFGGAVEATLSGRTLTVSGSGGIAHQGYTEDDNIPFYLQGHVGSTAPTAPAIQMVGYKSNGTDGRTGMSGGEIVLKVSGAADLLTLKGNGDILLNTTAFGTGGVDKMMVVNNGVVSYAAIPSGSGSGSLQDATNIGATTNDAISFTNSSDAFLSTAGVVGMHSNGFMYMQGGTAGFIAAASTDRLQQIQARADNNRIVLYTSDGTAAALRMRISGVEGFITFNESYTFPLTIGSPGQSLKVPASGSNLEWGTSTIDATPTNGSTNAVQSDGVFDALALKANLAGGTFSGNISVPDEAYDATTWNGNNNVATKNAIRDKIEAIVAGGGTDAENITYTNPVTGTGARSVEARLADELWVEDFRVSGDTDADVWEKAITAMNTLKRRLNVANKEYIFNRTIIVTATYWNVRGEQQNGLGSQISGAITGYERISSTVTADTSYATTSAPGPMRGAAFYFTDFVDYSRTENLVFYNLRYGMAFYWPHNTPQFINLVWNTCNVGNFCYQGSQDYTYVGCSSPGTNVVHIAGATCFPSGHPQAGLDNYYADGLKITNEGGYYGQLSASENAFFDTWFVASILRPSTVSVSAGGSYQYLDGGTTGTLYSDTSFYSMPTGRVVFIPMRNPRTTFSPIFNSINVRTYLLRGFALINSSIVGLQITGGFNFEQVFTGDTTSTAFFTIGALHSGIVTAPYTTLNGAQYATHPLVSYSNRGFSWGYAENEQRLVWLTKPERYLDLTYTNGNHISEFSTVERDALTPGSKKRLIENTSTGFLNYHNGSAWKEVVTLDGTQTLTNKTATTQSAGNNTTALATTAFVTTAVAAVSGGSDNAISTKSSAYTLLSTDSVILANTASAFTLTLPAASTVTGKKFYIKKISADNNAVTIDANASETIDGDLTKEIYAQYVSITIVSDGSNWFILYN